VRPKIAVNETACVSVGERSEELCEDREDGERARGGERLVEWQAVDPFTRHVRDRLRSGAEEAGEGDVVQRGERTRLVRSGGACLPREDLEGGDEPAAFGAEHSRAGRPASVARGRAHGPWSEPSPDLEVRHGRVAQAAPRPPGTSSASTCNLRGDSRKPASK